MNAILTQLNIELRSDIILRVALSLSAGLILGIKHDQRIGIAKLRDTLLITLASCFVMIISDSLYVQSLVQVVSTTSWQIAPSLLAAGAVMGLGFIGASALIYHSKHLVHDTTTAAILWFAALVGLSFGAGLFAIGILVTVITFFILLLVPKVEGIMKRGKDAEAASPSNLELVIQPVSDTSKHPEPIEIITAGDLENSARKNSKHDAVEELTRHLSLNQIFPSDLKQKRSTFKLKRIKSRRVIAYMF